MKMYDLMREVGMGVDGFRLDSAKRKIRFKQYSFLTGSKYLR